ncbi:DNA topoisomerase III [Catenovulum sp. 2E275]|uniref:DNA topoisomerase III n=1 Tax=Catenovulum sp. 2E275 TaxID=2980497 RepID=UPI0021D189ED|nr:DNA topoisomerase III [Catenovulum sp. 2E275]MCU4675195.1 DNA topoisomerase III [Catenovulum sp. 2E275]
MKLYIAEKPSLARAIAAVLPKPQKNQQGYIELANGDCISWCIGHLLENAEPQDYQPEFKQWKATDLPIIPSQWRLKAKPKTKSQLSVLSQLIKQADQLIHAGDPDREGQLLVDEVFAHFKVNQQKLAQTQRLLISDLNPSAVKTALNKLQNNKQFAALSTSALARSRADWLFGLNLTRAYTLQAKQVGYQNVLSVGRVQTPVLGLVVRRDQAIDEFVSKPYYQVFAHVKINQTTGFSAKWQPSEACAAHLDEEGRVLNKALAEHVVKQIEGQDALIKKAEQTNKKQAAPLPYNLSALQIDAAKIFSLSAQDTLSVCQSLYEKHKLITYPRSDCRYLPNEHFFQAKQVSAAIANNASELATACQQANLSQKSKAWNDSKVDAHHAIIPTAKQSSAQLTHNEQKIYQLICKQYLVQFFPPWQYQDNSIECLIKNGLFIAKHRQTTDLGWKTLIGSKIDKQADKNEPSATNQNKLPKVKAGDIYLCTHGELIEKMTQPPQAFTDASLLAAMTGISRYVSDPQIRKILKETDGLGTEATRAGIIELLFKRQFLTRSGKQIKATETGKALVLSLPEQLTLPDMTAQWEASLEAICQRQLNYQSFIEPLLVNLQQLVELAKQAPNEALKQAAKNQPVITKRTTKKFTSRYKKRTKSASNKPKSS